jgi:hypothetical protein
VPKLNQPGGYSLVPARPPHAVQPGAALAKRLYISNTAGSAFPHNSGASFPKTPLWLQEPPQAAGICLQRLQASPLTPSAPPLPAFFLVQKLPKPPVVVDMQGQSQAAYNENYRYQNPHDVSPPKIKRGIASSSRAAYVWA